MPTQLSKGTTFVDGSSDNSASDLNNLVDAGTILPGAISEQPSISSVNDADLLLLRQNSSSLLKKVTFANLTASLPIDAAAGTASLRRLGTTSTKAAAGNDTRFPASVTGIRTGAGAGSQDAAATGRDFAFPVDLSGHTEIDWDAGNLFYDSMGNNKTYTFANVREGRAITVIITLNGHTATMPFSPEEVGTGTSKKIFNFYRTDSVTVGFVVKT